MDQIITLQNVSKYYKLYDEPKDRLKEALSFTKHKYHKEFYALKNLDLSVKRGEVVGIIGRNGCGKSTLLKLITGVLQPSEGSISVAGKVTALLELGAGFNPEFSGLENIYFYGKVLGLTDRELDENLESIKTFAELGDFLRQPVKTYSSGMKARLGFSVAIHIAPDILILDEVLAVGDAQFRRKCYAKIEELFSSGCTVILVSHDDQAVAKMCSRAVLIEGKCVKADGPAREILKIYQDSIVKAQKKTISKQLEKQPSVQPLIRGEIEESRAATTSHRLSVERVSILDEKGEMCQLVSCRQPLWVEVSINYSLKTTEKLRVAFNIRDTQGVVKGGGVIQDIELSGTGTKTYRKEIFQSFAPGNYFVTGTCNQWINHGWVVADRKQDVTKFEIKEWLEEGYWGGDFLGPIK